MHREHVAYRLGYMGLLDPHVALSAAIHPTAQVGNMAEWIGHETAYPVEIGANTVIRPFVTIDSGVNRRTRIGADCLVMAHAHIGHDVVIGDRTNVAPGAVVCGCVTIGSDVKVGVNSCIRPHVTVGDGAVIGMGAVVVGDVPAGVTVVGNPARQLVRAGGEENVGSRLFGVVALGNGKHESVALEGGLDRPERTGTAGRDRGGDSGEHDGPAQWQDGECLACAHGHSQGQGAYQPELRQFGGLCNFAVPL